MRYDEMDAIAEKMFLEGKSVTRIAKELKIDRGCLSIRLKKRGLNITQHCNKIAIDSYIFSEINNEEKAYWLGFLMADGCVADNNKIELTLKDYEHLLKFKIFLKSEHSIQEKNVLLNNNNYINYKISFSDKQITRDLKRYGCIPRKTFAMSMPNLSVNLMRHWIRGYLDGDGHIKLGKTLGSSFITIASGNSNILYQLRDYFIKNVSDKINITIRKTHSCYEFRTTNMETLQLIINFLYLNSTISLERKYHKIMQICRLESKTHGPRRLKIISAELSGEAVKYFKQLK